MDAIERRKIIAAMKAKADEALAERQKQTAERFQMGLDARKAMALTDHEMKRLDDPKLKRIRQMDDRPGEKLALNSNGVMKKERKSGKGGPGVG